MSVPVYNEIESILLVLGDEIDYDLNEIVKETIFKLKDGREIRLHEEYWVNSSNAVLFGNEQLWNKLVEEERIYYFITFKEHLEELDIKWPQYA
jgi:hypothetical protein